MISIFLLAYYKFATPNIWNIFYISFLNAYISF